MLFVRRLSEDCRAEFARAESARERTQLTRWLQTRLDLLKAKSGGGGALSKLGAKIATLDVNERNRKGDPLLVAVVRYITEPQLQCTYVSILLAEGADTEQADRKGRTALMVALKNHSVQAAQLLIDSPADHCVVDRSGNTALVYAVQGGDVPCAQRLIDAILRRSGIAALTQKNHAGKTALDFANKNSNVLMKRLFDAKRLDELCKTFESELKTPAVKVVTSVPYVRQSRAMSSACSAQLLPPAHLPASRSFSTACAPLCTRVEEELEEGPRIERAASEEVHSEGSFRRSYSAYT